MTPAESSVQEPDEAGRSWRSAALRAGTVAASVAFLAYWVVGHLLNAVDVSLIVFDRPRADGPFQLFNALRRIDAGQRGGVDFQFFHGIGLPYLFYPFYRLFGGSIHGSEFARQLIPLAI